MKSPLAKHYSRCQKEHVKAYAEYTIQKNPQLVHANWVKAFLRYELSLFNDAHSVQEWFDSGIAISLDSDAYKEYEEDMAFTARKTAKAKATFVRDYQKSLAR